MKPSILTSFLALAASTALAAQDEPAKSSTPAPPTPPTPPAAPSASTHVTITIESGGKKETREIDLGDGSALKMLKPAVAFAAGVASGGDKAFVVKVDREPKPWLGIVPDELPEEVRAQLAINEGAGLILRSVVPDGPAAKAGLQKNDVLVKLDDQLLINGMQLRALIRAKKAGDQVRLTYYRGGKSAETSVQIAMHEGGDAAEDAWSISHYLPFPGGGIESFRDLASPLKFESKLVLVDKDGRVLISKGQPDLSAATARVEQILRDAGVDEKTIAAAKRGVGEALAALSPAAIPPGAVDSEVARQIRQRTEEFAKSLEQARDAAEQARQRVLSEVELRRQQALEQTEETRKRIEKQLQQQRQQTPAPQQ